MKIPRLVFAAIWICILWGMIGGIAKIVTKETPDWLVMVLAIAGGVAMWLYVYFKETE